MHTPGPCAFCKEAWLLQAETEEEEDGGHFLDPREDRRGKSRPEVGAGGCAVVTGAGKQQPLPLWPGVKCNPSTSSLLLTGLVRLSGLQETRVATREESGVLGFPSRRGLTPRGSLEYFSHLMRRADSFEKTLMLGKIEGRRRLGGGRDEEM